MAKTSVVKNLYDPRNGDPAIRTSSLQLDCKPTDPARTNYFSVYFIESGSGTFWADASSFEFAPDALVFFVPYQHIRFVPSSPVQGQVVQFHANFLCVETFHAEVGCSGILFNDPYGTPLVSLNKRAKSEVKNLIHRIQQEQGRTHGEILGPMSSVPRQARREKGAAHRPLPAGPTAGRLDVHRVAILGGGGMGTAMALVLDRAGAEVRLWVREPDRAALMAATRRNERHLPDVVIPEAVTVTGDAAQAMEAATLLVASIPTSYLRSTLAGIASVAPAAAVRAKSAASAGLPTFDIW